MNLYTPPWQPIQRNDQSLAFTSSAGTIQLTLCSATVVRVRAWRNTPQPHRSWSPFPADAAWEAAEWSSTDHGSATELTLPGGRVVVDRQDGSLRFINQAGLVFSADSSAVTFVEQTARVDKMIAADEYFYGFGERTGKLEKRGQRYVNWTWDPEDHHSARVNEMYAALPVFMGLRAGFAYGVALNSTFYSTFDIGASDPAIFTWSTHGPELDYYLSFGPTPAAVMADLRTLLGATPLPPRWAMGYHQSRWSYPDAPTVRDLAAQFRGRLLPCDVIHFDIDYMDGYRVFTWDATRFPDPQQLIADLRTQGFHVVTIIDPGVKVDPHYAVFQASEAQDYFIRRADGTLFTGYVWPDTSAFADYTRPEVRTWWGRLHKTLVEAGVQGIWDDMNEPTVFERPFSEGGGRGGTIDLDAPQGPAAERTTHAEVHNLYGLLMAQATHEGLKALRPNERPFVLTRSGFLGIQRWATLWTGDNSALWEHLELTLPQICNLGLSGVPFCGVDIGGFFGNASPELWARWMQLGAFLPFCRGHSCAGTRQAEPWMFGERVEAIARAYLTLRYRLLPYLYTLFQQAASTGAPIIRPLLYEFPADSATYEGYDEALCGSQLLLAPIVRPGFEHRAVYLPAGTWYDWWTGERLEGPLHLLAHAPLERMPLYVRGGSVLTLGPAMQYTDELPLDELTLDVYPAGVSEWTMYEDDGCSFDFEQGGFATTAYRCTETASGVRFEIAARAGGWTPAPRTLVVNLRCQPPRSVELDGTATAAWVYDEGALTLTLPDDGAAHSIEVLG